MQPTARTDRSRGAVCASEHDGHVDVASGHVQLLCYGVYDLVDGLSPADRVTPTCGTTSGRRDDGTMHTRSQISPQRFDKVTRAPHTPTCMEKLKVMNSMMGRMPCIAAPTPKPAKPACGQHGGTRSAPRQAPRSHGQQRETAAHDTPAPAHAPISVIGVSITLSGPYFWNRPFETLYAPW